MKLRLRRVTLLVLVLLAVPVAAIWQDFLLDRDFYALDRLLYWARYHAIHGTEPVIVRFSDHTAFVETLDGQTLEQLSIPTLARVRHETTLGAGRVVFGVGHGQTSAYNVHLHGGDMLLRSWFGGERSLWVHCTGGVTGGLNEDWAKN